MSGMSGQEQGAINVAKLKAYLDRVDILPMYNGKPNVSAIAAAIGLRRKAIYDNPTCRRMLDEAARAKGLGGTESREGQDLISAHPKLIKLERRVHELEQANAALMAENQELRERLKRFAHIEQHMILTGRTVR